MTGPAFDRTFGVEEELLLVDPDTGIPRPLGDSVVRSAGGEDDDTPGGVEHELKRQQVELGTEPRHDLAGVGEDLRRLRRRLDTAARRHGLRLAALATSPLAVTPLSTEDERYERMLAEYGLTAAELLVNGSHIHVSVESLDEAVGVLDRVRPWLAVLTALSANSPFWQGADSGYASYRQRAWSRWPSAGPTELFGDPTGYRDAVERMVSCGAAMDEGMVYFDARASRLWPTVELRVCDVCLDVDHAVVLAGLGRGLVETAAREWREGVPPAPVRVEVLRGAAWRAARSGVRDTLVDPVTATAVVASEQVQRLLDHVTPALTDYGDLDRVRDGVERILAGGTGADAQRRSLDEQGSLEGVVREAVSRTVA